MKLLKRIVGIPVWVPVVAALCLAPLTVLGSEEGWEAADKKWVKGPVSYLLTDEETKAYKKAKNPEDRQAFIDAFWAKRAPRDGEEPNPFKQRFYARVASVDEQLKQQGIPAGWKSDLGRVLILLGQPQQFRFQAPDTAEGPDGSTPSGPSRTGGGGEAPGAGGGGAAGAKILLAYADLSRFGLAKNLELEFQQVGLTFQLNTRVDLTTDAVRGLDRELLAQDFPPGVEAPKAEVIDLTPTAPEPAAEAVAAGSVQRETLLAALDGNALGEAFPFEASVDFYKAKMGKTYVAITLGIPGATYAESGGDGSLHPMAALRDQADPQNLYLYDSDDLFAPSESNAAAGPDGLLRFQAGDGVDPGKYTVVTGWVNEDGSVVSQRTQDLEVPNYDVASVLLSSITLAESWDNTDEGGGELKRPYILGNRKVIPKVKPVYPANGNLAVYYQIYNAAKEGVDPNLRIGYHVYRKRGSRFTKAATVPPLDGVKELVQIYELSLAGWPRGDYKLKVNVTDNQNGGFGEREVFFRIE